MLVQVCGAYETLSLNSPMLQWVQQKSRDIGSWNYRKVAGSVYLATVLNRVRGNRIITLLLVWPYEVEGERLFEEPKVGKIALQKTECQAVDFRMAILVFFGDVTMEYLHGRCKCFFILLLWWVLDNVIPTVQRSLSTTENSVQYGISIPYGVSLDIVWTAHL